MGISYSDLSDEPALTVISKFIIVKESFDLFINYWSDDSDQKRNKIIMRLLVAGLVLDISRRNFQPVIENA